MRTGVQVPTQGINILDVLGEEFRCTRRTEGGSRDGALLRHLLDGVHHICYIGIGNAVECCIYVEFPGEGVAATGEFLYRPGSIGADGIAESLPVLGRLAIRSGS